jgi:hypothetical protein
MGLFVQLPVREFYLKENKYLFPEDIRWNDSYILTELFCVTGYVTKRIDDFHEVTLF